MQPSENGTEKRYHPQPVNQRLSNTLEQHALEQKRAAVRHCPAHGRCDTPARREPGCPKCTAKLAERIDEHAPGERRATQPRAFGASEKAAAARRS